ncbi:MAG: hypothetical protein HY516_05370 [Candidatus Aenigmarchaeota archaeon]|nr:hypothetical protein [Candidatus Aenigmarchaeota archaeon]
MPFVDPGTSERLQRLKELYAEDPRKAEVFFRSLNHLAAGQNLQFLDGMFGSLREIHPYSDFALVDGDGRKMGEWATFLEMPSKKEPPSDMEILERVVGQGRFSYIIPASRSRLLFFMQDDAEAVNGSNGGDLHMSLHDRLHDGTVIGRAWAVPRKNYDHAPPGYAVGRITFWDTRLGDVSERDGQKNGNPVLILHSAYVVNHPAGIGKVTITPLKRSGVVATGGLPVDAKYENYRVETDHNYYGFVAGAMEGYRRDQTVKDNPLVLAYSSRRKLEFVHSKPAG